ncbi:MAG: hypothetical protein LBD23_06235 [Oscillospiraceae bacterium]|jgi:hypothetical protein|nr:hypothetical protein [Oscillospiraceae bacterium]
MFNIFSISDLTEHKETAWSFIRQFYTLEYYIEHSEDFVSIPFNTKALDLHINADKEALERKISTDEYEITYQGASDYDIKRFRDMDNVIVDFGFRSNNKKSDYRAGIIYTTTPNEPWGEVHLEDNWYVYKYTMDKMHSQFFAFSPFIAMIGGGRKVSITVRRIE